MGQIVFSLIIPVYMNEENLPRLLEAVADLDQGIQTRYGQEIEAVFVVDGSPDRSYECLQDALPQQDFKSKLVLLSRNFGAFSAIRSGLELAQGSTFGVMAADLQEPPELIFNFVESLIQDEADVVVGVRTKRDDPLLNRILSKLFWSLYRRTIVRDMPQGGVDIFGCNKMFRDHLIRFTEARSSLVAQVFWVGFRRKEIPYMRNKRLEGRSAWSFRKRLEYMSDSIFAFTDLPIQILTKAGFIGVALSLMVAVIVIIARLAGLIIVPGYTALMIVTIFFGSLNLLAFGVVGNYAWRTYTNTKNRPLAIVARISDHAGSGDAL